MSASASFELEQFQSGYFLAWEVLTQCAYTVQVTLTANGKNYLTASKTNGSTGLQLISQNSADYNSNGPLVLTITVNESSGLKQSMTSGAVTDQKARKVGYSYSICIEDSGDDDFNDVYVNIVGWAKKG